jgi:fatty-acid desaturase
VLEKAEVWEEEVTAHHDYCDGQEDPVTEEMLVRFEEVCEGAYKRAGSRLIDCSTGEAMFEL